jgi:tetratricopeptide (TPR) repeat protein
MSNVDLFISYLSGELKDQEVRSLEERLATDPAFKQEFAAVSEAYALIRDQLRKRDENAFRNKLLEAMERNNPVPVWYTPSRRRWGYYLIPLAGALALLITLVLSGKGPDRLVSRFYHPDRDQVLLAFSQVTRGSSEQGAILFHEGHYQACMDEMNRQLEADPENELALLYYLLSSLEVGREELALRKFEQFSFPETDQLEQSIFWYASMAMVKTGRTEEAAQHLEILEKSPGPYHTDAVRLRKLLLK